MSEVESTFQLEPGEVAPEFTLAGADGVAVSRAEASGPHGLLVVFACNHCPYVIHLADALGELARELAAQGVGTVAINANDVANYPQDRPELMARFAAAHRWEFPYLFDESQSVAQAYGAACTPDFFLLDGDGRLVYAGQFDDTRPGSKRPADGRDLRAAVQRMLDGEPPVARPVPSSGCNIKWRPGKQPPWWNRGSRRG